MTLVIRSVKKITAIGKENVKKKKKKKKGLKARVVSYDVFAS